MECLFKALIHDLSVQTEVSSLFRLLSGSWKCCKTGHNSKNSVKWFVGDITLDQISVSELKEMLEQSHDMFCTQKLLRIITCITCNSCELVGGH